MQVQKMAAVARHQRPAILRMLQLGLAAGAQRRPGWLACVALWARQQLGLRLPGAPQRPPIQKAGLAEELHQQSRKEYQSI